MIIQLRTTNELVLVSATAVTAARAAVTVTTAVAAAKGALRAIFQRAGFLDDQGSAAVLAVVKGVNRCLGFGVVFEFDEPESAGAAGHFVRNHSCRAHGAVSAKQLL